MRGAWRDEGFWHVSRSPAAQRLPGHGPVAALAAGALEEEGEAADRGSPTNGALGYEEGEGCWSWAGPGSLNLNDACTAVATLPLPSAAGRQVRRQWGHRPESRRCCRRCYGVGRGTRSGPCEPLQQQQQQRQDRRWALRGAGGFGRWEGRMKGLPLLRRPRTLWCSDDGSGEGWRASRPSCAGWARLARESNPGHEGPHTVCSSLPVAQDTRPAFPSYCTRRA